MICGSYLIELKERDFDTEHFSASTGTKYSTGTVHAIMCVNADESLLAVGVIQD